MRPRMSVPPPGGNGRMSLIGFDGYAAGVDCASGCVQASAQASVARMTPRRPAVIRLLLRHCRRVMARDEPVLAGPLVGERIARLDDRAVAELERIEAGVEGGVAVDLDHAAVDGAGRLLLQEMVEVILLFLRREARLVR